MTCVEKVHKIKARTGYLVEISCHFLEMSGKSTTTLRTFTLTFICTITDELKKLNNCTFSFILKKQFIKNLVISIRKLFLRKKLQYLYQQLDEQIKNAHTENVRTKMLKTSNSETTK